MSEKVKNMFADIADDYDRINSILSFGVHNAWRKKTVLESNAKQGDKVLDCATGTGDLAIEFKKAVGHQGKVVGTDFCQEMIEHAPGKAEKEKLVVTFEVADAMDLPYEDDEFDITEYIANKSLDLSIDTNTSISVIWLLFSNFGSVPISSFYHLTDEEVENRTANLLNYTASIDEEEANYYSSELDLDIPSYRIEIPLSDDNEIIAFYDMTYHVLMGIELEVADHRVLDGAEYVIRLTIASTTFDLASEEPFPVLMISGVVAGVILGGGILFLLIRRLRSPSIMEGGMN